MPRYETTRGYLTTVEKAAIVRERRGDEPRSSTQVAVKAVSVVQRTTHSIYCELRSLPCSVKYPRAVVLEEMACSPAWVWRANVVKGKQ